MARFLKTLTGLTLGLLVAGMMFGQALASEDSIQKKVIDGYSVELSFPDGELQEGHNKATVRIHDSRGQPVIGAVVSIGAGRHEAEQDSGNSGGQQGGGHNMGTSGASAASAPAGIGIQMEHMVAGGAGEHIGEVGLASPGEWMVEVGFNHGGRERTASFVVHVEDHGPNWTVIWGFVGLIMVVLTTAAVTRKKVKASPSPEEVS